VIEGKSWKNLSTRHPAAKKGGFRRELSIPVFTKNAHRLLASSRAGHAECARIEKLQPHGTFFPAFCGDPAASILGELMKLKWES
jgi:hypothetical protein